MAHPLFPEVVVNGEVVPHTEIAAEAQNHRAPRSKPGIAWQRAARALALRTLLIQEVERRGGETTPKEFGAGRIEDQEEARIRGMLEDAVGVETPTEAEVRREWARDPARFRTPPLWEASHILITCNRADDQGLDRAKSIADRLIARIVREPEKFGEIAAEHSDCSSRASKGFLGQIRPGDTHSEFERELQRLKPGELSGTPVLTPFGIHIIRLDAFVAGKELPFEVARSKVAEAMEKVAWAKATREIRSLDCVRSVISHCIASIAIWPQRNWMKFDAKKGVTWGWASVPCALWNPFIRVPDRRFARAPHSRRSLLDVLTCWTTKQHVYVWFRSCNLAM